MHLYASAGRRTSLALAGVASLAGLAFAAPAAATARPHHPICDPSPGTILSSKADGLHSAWQPTNVASAFVAGPGTIARTVTKTSQVSVQLSASFSVEEGFLFASAKETYGISVTKSVSHSAAWTYSLAVPKGVTAKVQQYHQSYELGIVQKVVKQTANGCPDITEKSLTGNFFPANSTSESSYCYALTTSKNPGVQVASTCKNEI